MFLNHFGIYHQSVHNIQAQIKDTVDGKEAFRYAQSLLAESSSVLSNHCVADVIAGFSASTITNLEREAIRSLRMGFLLYAMAEEPIWDFSKGSSTSFRC